MTAGKSRIDILGVGFDNVTMDETISALEDILGRGEKSYIVTPNSEIVYEALKDDELRNLLRGADLVIPDGAGVVLASRILGTPLKEKVAGIEVAENLLPSLVRMNKKLFLLGAKPGIAERAADRMREIAPGIDICGCRNGYFDDDESVVEEINSRNPDVIYVCLGAPRQEFWIKKNMHRLNATMFIGLGGSLDGFSGEVKRAPRIFIKLNLEWFYRLIKEPYRLGRMMRLPKFIIKVLAFRIKNQKIAKKV